MQGNVNSCKTPVEDESRIAETTYLLESLENQLCIKLLWKSLYSCQGFSAVSLLIRICRYPSRLSAPSLLAPISANGSFCWRLRISVFIKNKKFAMLGKKEDTGSLFFTSLLKTNPCEFTHIYTSY